MICECMETESSINLFHVILEYKFHLDFYIYNTLNRLYPLMRSQVEDETSC